MDKEILMKQTNDYRRAYDRAEIELIQFLNNDVLTASEGLIEEQNEGWTPWF